MTTKELVKTNEGEVTEPQKRPLEELVFGKAQPGDETRPALPVTGQDLHDLHITWATFQVLSQYQEFTDNDRLRAFLRSIPELKPFLSRMPETMRTEDRISQVLPWLLKDCKRADGADVLEAVIRTLYDRGTTRDNPDVLVACAHCGRAHPWGQPICESCSAPIEYKKDFYIFRP